MIRNIIFDMGGVLIDFAPYKFADRYPDLSPEEKKLLVEVIFEGHMWPLLDFGYITEDELLEYARKRIPERLHPVAEALIKTWDEPILPVPGIAQLTGELRDAGYRLFLLSNAGPRHDEYWPKIPGSSNFEGKVVSAYEKLFKPQPEIYELLLRRFSLKASECLFIDDVATNCAAARICGIEPIRFTSEAELRKALAGRGIDIV
jgi:putative hydrolase of the HAD superfamily